MSKLIKALNKLPETKQNVVAVLSGGMDSTIMTLLLVERYGKERVSALSYNYGQKQSVELERAGRTTDLLGIPHKVLDLKILGEIVKPVSANITGTNVNMPTIEDILGDPQPKTEVPFRNMILLSLSLAYAQSTNSSHVFTGLQVHDAYAYWDTTQRFVDGVNKLAEQNRTHQIKVEAPFSQLSKQEELELCKELGKLNLLKNTITCYNPDNQGKSCAKCPSCSERIRAFLDLGVKDPIEYQIEIPWKIK